MVRFLFPIVSLSSFVGGVVELSSPKHSWSTKVGVWFVAWVCFMKILHGQNVESEKRFKALFELLVWPHKVEPWFYSWYRGRVETLDAKYNLIFR